jgi:iron complex outermembrane recepter protein
MKPKILLYLVCIFFSVYVNGQAILPDSSNTVSIEEVVVTANRIPILLKSNPGAVSLVNTPILSSLPKAIGAEEALRFVPGVMIDNQHDGERIHLSIRGQGILTERGLRGIGVLIDGIPVNDPSGFAPDLYDVDWNNVSRIEVLRGPSAGLYGGSGAAGVISISTLEGGDKHISGKFIQSAGSNGFFKSFIRTGGSGKNIDYNLVYSRDRGDGYRDHQAFRSNKFYEKITCHPMEGLSLTQIISHSEYFQQNPEGLNISQFGDLRQANPDARPFNEYQKTGRTTLALLGNYRLSRSQDVKLSYWFRSWDYKETSNRCAEYRDHTVPGFSTQYNLSLNTGVIKHRFSLGLDRKWQDIKIYKLQSLSNPARIESLDEKSFESDSLLANQLIHQSGSGIFLIYSLEAGNFNLIGNVRFDAMSNELIDKMAGASLPKTIKKFEMVSSRIGASYTLSKLHSLFANWSQGFMPPSTEELASNPLGYNGFNTHLVPAVSSCIETGARGFIIDKLQYEITGFYMETENDFFRFKQSGRGNQEVFYGNAGNSRRKGIELYFQYNILSELSLQTSYTFSDFRYTSATIDPVYTDTTYVLTTPPLAGQWLPNSPKHQLYSELVYSLNKNLKFSMGTEYQSEWAVYTDARAYHGELDPAVFQNWQDGFNLYNVRASYSFDILKIKGSFSVSVRNLGSQKYMAFTEPDPDGNAYHPGPGREIFGSLSLNF